MSDPNWKAMVVALMVRMETVRPYNVVVLSADELDSAPIGRLNARSHRKESVWNLWLDADAETVTTVTPTVVEVGGFHFVDLKDGQGWRPLS